MEAGREYQSSNATIRMRASAPGVVVIEFDGRDIGEFGRAPFDALEAWIREYGASELFIDARGARGASLDVSSAWARWLAKHRADLQTIHMLTGSRFIQLSAEFVRKFAGLGQRMRIYTDSVAFEAALRTATAREV